MKEAVKWALVAAATLGAYALVFSPELIKEWPVVKAVVKGIIERNPEPDRPDTDTRT